MNSYTLRWTPILLLTSWALSGCRSHPTGPVWNVPELVGQPIDAVKQKLGPPQSETAAGGDVQQSTWQREGTTLVANWKTTNKRVREWTLVSREQSDAASEEDKAKLLQVGQLQENTPQYSVDWIEATERPFFYTGVKVTPTLKNHQVTLRLSGPTALIGISYTITGPQGKSDAFDTVTPFEESLTLPDDSQITFKALLKKSLGQLTTPLKAEIISDGKVVSTASSTGGLLTCETEL